MTTRVHIGRLDTITGGTDQFGLYVNGPDGSTIIDGTSDVFRIVATGGITWSAFTGPGFQDDNIDFYTGLPEPITSHISFIDSGSTSVPLPRVQIDTSTGVVNYMWRTFISNNAGATRLTARYQTILSGANGPWSGRYYLLEQVGL